VTTAEELRRTLDPFVTAASTVSFFWARWEEAMLPYEWQGGSGSEREWRIVNVLARFTDCLNDFVSRVPPPPLAEASLDCGSSGRETASVSSDRLEGSILFGKDGAALRGSSHGLLRHPAPFTADLGWDRIHHLRIRYGSSSESLYVTVHFRPAVARVSFAGILLPPRDVWRLAGALAANNPRRR
jgi:hypothetical protein